MLAGALMPLLATKRGADRAILLGTLLCMASLVLVVALPRQTVYYAALLLFGFGNAGTRVARSALFFSLVPNAVMGRVGTFFGVFDRVLRTVLTFAMTLVLAQASAVLCFTVLLAVLLAALAGTLATRDVARKPDPAAPPAS